MRLAITKEKLLQIVDKVEDEESIRLINEINDNYIKGNSALDLNDKEMITIIRQRCFELIFKNIIALIEKERNKTNTVLIQHLTSINTNWFDRDMFKIILKLNK